MPTSETPALTYVVRPTRAQTGSLRVSVKDGQGRSRTLGVCASTEPGKSPFGSIGVTILTHYFQTQKHEPRHRAATLATHHHGAISRLISARLTRRTTATLTDSEIAAHLLKHIMSPPIDHWIHRYSVPSSSGDASYTVAEKDDGTWGCTCPVYKFRHIECKHIEAAKSHPAWYPFQSLRS
jgi:hypothetical protein